MSPRTPQRRLAEPQKKNAIPRGGKAARGGKRVREKQEHKQEENIMKIWKRIGAMAMVTAFSALALTGCGAGGRSSGGG